MKRAALLIGVCSLLAAGVIALWPANRHDFFNAYLFAWIFWLGISMGSLGLGMLHVLTGGQWGDVIRPVTTPAAKLLPLLLLLFLPILLGMAHLFPWARAGAGADLILAHAHRYLNEPFFVARLLIYFAVWIGLSVGLLRLRNASALRRLSAGGLLLYVVLMSFAGVDWIMSREPHFVSSIFGFVLVIAQTLSAMCFAVTMLWLQRRAGEGELAPVRIDLGNIMLTLVILWAYLNFSQFLIIWTGNEQTDIGWYVHRTYGGWRWVAGLLILAHFFVPFFALLSRDLKSDLQKLGRLAAMLVLFCLLDTFWNQKPLGQPDVHTGFSISILDLLALLGIGGVWFAAFILMQERTTIAPRPIEELSEGSDDVRTA